MTSPQQSKLPLHHQLTLVIQAPSCAILLDYLDRLRSHTVDLSNFEGHAWRAGGELWKQTILDVAQQSLKPGFTPKPNFNTNSH